MSSHLQWMLLRNNSCFLLRGAHGQTFTTEPNNLKGKNSFRHNGLIHKKTVGIEASKSGIVLITRKQSCRQKPAKSLKRVSFKNLSGSRRVLGKIRSTLGKNCYRKDLKATALRRASALLRAQKTLKPEAKSSKKPAEKWMAFARINKSNKNWKASPFFSAQMRSHIIGSDDNEELTNEPLFYGFVKSLLDLCPWAG